MERIIWFCVVKYKFGSVCLNLNINPASTQKPSPGQRQVEAHPRCGMKYQPRDRRPIPVRNNPLAQRATEFLARNGVSVNTISSFSLLFGLGAGVSLIMTAVESSIFRIWWALSAILILLRLLANMLDGMVAIESGKISAVGELFNEIPDRVSDVAIFVGAGFAANSSPHLGYTAAILSLFVAYIRALGNQMGVTDLFLGPMSKQQRMFTLIAIFLFYALAPTVWQSFRLLGWGLWLIILGSVLTILSRIRHIVMRVNS